jgi:hypothetical protein
VWINRPEPPQPIVGEKSDPVGSPQSHEVQPGKGMGIPQISAAVAETINSSALASRRFALGKIRAAFGR